MSDPVFKWGKKKVVGENDSQFYESFTYKGEEYFLYDCVYLNDENEEPFIGKLVKMWERVDKQKVVKTVWFFRQVEVQNWLEEVVPRPSENEIFLACGEGLGVSNLNVPEALAGKCNVVCTSKDKRNPQPSKEDLQNADYIFYRTFDVGKFEFSDEIVNKIAKTEAKCFFNKEVRKDSKGKAAKIKESMGLEGSSSDSFSSEQKPENDNLKRKRVFDDSAKSSNSQEPGISPPSAFRKEITKKKLKSSYTDGVARSSPCKTTDYRFKTGYVRDSNEQQSRITKKSNHGEEAPKPLQRAGLELANEKVTRTDSRMLEVTRKQDIDRSGWFNQLSEEKRMERWEEKMKTAYHRGTLVLLQNFDPAYTSKDVEDLVFLAFKELCIGVTVIPQTAYSIHTLELRPRQKARRTAHTDFINPWLLFRFNPCQAGKSLILSTKSLNSQALVIFQSKETADMVVSRLQTGVLMLPNSRVLLGRKDNLLKPASPKYFPGHLSFPISKFRMKQEWRDAVSTSHLSQLNTIEYDFALEWCLLQQQCDVGREAVYQKQAREINELKNPLKNCYM